MIACLWCLSLTVPWFLAGSSLGPKDVLQGDQVLALLVANGAATLFVGVAAGFSGLPWRRLLLLGGIGTTALCLAFFVVADGSSSGTPDDHGASAGVAILAIPTFAAVAAVIGVGVAIGITLRYFWHGSARR